MEALAIQTIRQMAVCHHLSGRVGFFFFLDIYFNIAMSFLKKTQLGIISEDLLGFMGQELLACCAAVFPLLI